MSARLDELFLRRVDRDPDAVAVVDGGTTLTYRDLLDRASAVAAGLAERGVRRETPVGMAFERSADAIVAMVGIVLAGGAYVPVNPRFPQSRLGDMLGDAGVRLVLCDPAARERVAGAADADAVGLAELARPGAFTTPTPSSDGSPLAYVMFTSGSTGRPKGVLVEHGGIVRLVHDPDYLDISPADRFTQLSALEFDASTFEVWGALLNGAQLHVVDRETAAVPWRLAEFLRDHAITISWLTSAQFNQFADEDPGMFAPLRHLLTGGDVLSPRHVELVRTRHPNLVLHNGYGPTENTTFTAVHRIDRPCADGIPIGRPIRGTTALVLDDSGEPVPVGVVGELFTGGEGVARGYLDDEALTAQRFVHLRGERYYRTGDRVHVDADGVLHFHGRTDHQVKIRGNRVELGEVLAALRAVPGVADCHVRVVGESSTRRLVAYVVAPALSETAIRAALAEVLPDFAVPDRYVPLTRLPLNANGKVDAAALPDPTRAGAAEVTPEQRALAVLWGGVLGVDPSAIAPDDNFLEIGGNSLLLGVLLGRIRRHDGAVLSFTDAFAAPTLAAMAKAVEAATRDALPDIPAVERGSAVGLHPQQVGLYALWQADPDSLAYNIPARLRIRGPLDVPRLRKALVGVLRRHDALRMRFTVEGGEVRQVAVDDPDLALDHVTDAVADPLEGFVRPFHLDRPPLLRARLVRVDAGVHDLYLDTHHVVMDGVSLGLVVRDLLDLYDGRATPPPAVTYAAAARWSREQDDGADERFWRGELAGAPAGLSLPTDRPRGARRATRGAVVSRVARTDDVDRAARSLGTTPFAVLLAAYTATLARLTGQRDLVVGTPMSGRTHPALDSVVGMFVGTVCLRARLDDDTDLAALARRLGDRQSRALTHQHFPFERLVDRLAVPREPGRNPVFDALFAYQDLGFHEVRGDDLGVSLDLLNPGTTRFDLNLQVHRRPDGLVLDLEHAADLFSPASAAYLLDHCLLALDEVVKAPGTRVFARSTTAVSVPTADFAF